MYRVDYGHSTANVIAFREYISAPGASMMGVNPWM
jgi:hypothetical protein